MHTFVIPAYGQSPFIEACINSLLSQTVKSELVITTSTPSAFLTELTGKYQIPLYVNNKTGIANDWNFGLSKVTTQLATMAHQDDIYEPEYAENMIRAFTGNDNTLIAFTDYYDLLSDRKIDGSLNHFVKKALLFPFVIKNTISGKFLKKLILAFGDPICCPSVTFNLKLTNDIYFSPTYTCVLDWDAWYSLANKPGAFSFVNKKLVTHRIHGQSETTNQIQKGIRGREEMAMFERIWGKRIGSLLSWLYAGGHRHNKTS